MRDIDLTQIPFSKVIRVLKKRRAHLLERISSSESDLTYDKSEAKCLAYAIAVMCALRNTKWFCGTLESNRDRRDEEDDV